MKKLDWHLQTQQGDTWLGNVKDSGTSDSKWPPHTINLHRRASPLFPGATVRVSATKQRSGTFSTTTVFRPPRPQLSFLAVRYLLSLSDLNISFRVMKALLLLNCFLESVCFRPLSSLGFTGRFLRKDHLPINWIKIKFPQTCYNWYGEEGQLLSASGWIDCLFCCVPASCQVCMP